MQALWRELSEDCWFETFASVPGAEGDGHHDSPDGFCRERGLDLVMVRLVYEYRYSLMFV